MIFGHSLYLVRIKVLYHYILEHYNLAVNGITWYFLISTLILNICAIVFVILLIRRFIIKRTQGTLLLTIFYLLITIGEILNGSGLWISAFVLDANKASAYLELGFPLLYGIGYLFLYFFLSRHMMQDNDVIKAIISIILSAFIGIVFSFMIGEVFYEVSNPRVHQMIIMEGPELIQYLPSLLGGSLMLLPIFLIVHIRTIILAMKFQKAVSDPQEKIGFFFIQIAIFCLILSSLVAGVFTIPEIENIWGMYSLLHSLRMFFLFLGLLFGYFGWIYPDWLKNYIRKRIEKRNKKITQE